MFVFTCVVIFCTGYYRKGKNRTIFSRHFHHLEEIFLKNSGAFLTKNYISLGPELSVKKEKRGRTFEIPQAACELMKVDWRNRFAAKKKKCCKKNGTKKVKRAEEERMDDEAEAPFSVFANKEIQRNSDSVAASE